MIIKGQSRGRSRQLAAHLLRRDQNESVLLFEQRGVVADDVEGALAEMEARGAAVTCRRPLYHASISPEPDSPLTNKQVRVAVDTLEAALGLDGQPRVVVLHKKEGREHVHVVWSRIDVDRNRAISDSWNYRCHEEAARTLETLFGHRPVPRSYEKTTRRSRPRAPTDYEFRQAERGKSSVSKITEEISQYWHSSEDPDTFRAKLDGAGYRLARGDRRVLVVIDQNGEVHSLARRIDGASTNDIRARFRDVDLNSLPTVSGIREEARGVLYRTRKTKQFVAASREVTGSRPRGGTRSSRHHQTVRIARRAFREIADFGSFGSVPVRLSRSGMAPVRPRYRCLRGAIIAEFAAKMANVRRNVPESEREAALAALQAEREAALEALARRQEGEGTARGTLRKGRQRKPAGAVRRRRIRRRTVRRFRHST